MKPEDDKIKSILVILLAWLAAAALFMLVIFKLKILFHIF